MSIEVETTQFEFSHGRKPSGRGWWAFTVRNVRGAETVVFAPGQQTFSQARAWIRANAPADTIRIQVAP